MTIVKFLADKNGLYGFEISGHSSENSDDETGKIVCSAVSSAAYMTANTISDIIGDKYTAEVSEAKMFFTVKDPCEASKKLLEGFKLHLKALSGQYSNKIRFHGGAENVKD